MKRAFIIVCLLPLGAWYVNCNDFDQLPIRAHSDEIREIRCTGEGEEDANLAYLRVRACASELGLLRLPWGKTGPDKRICISETPFVCPGLPSQEPVAECAGSYIGGSVFVFVSRTWTIEPYDYRAHLDLGVLNLLIWLGDVDIPGDEGAVRANPNYAAMIGCMAESRQ